MCSRDITSPENFGTDPAGECDLSQMLLQEGRPASDSAWVLGRATWSSFEIGPGLSRLDWRPLSYDSLGLWCCSQFMIVLRSCQQTEASHEYEVPRDFPWDLSGAYSTDIYSLIWNMLSTVLTVLKMSLQFTAAPILGFPFAYANTFLCPASSLQLWPAASGKLSYWELWSTSPFAAACPLWIVMEHIDIVLDQNSVCLVACFLSCSCAISSEHED